MMNRRLTHEINLHYQIQGHVVNGVLHSFMDSYYDKAIFLIPGVYGDRCDSRAMYVNLARRLSQMGYSVIRFDYIGGGITLGDYSINDFDFMTETCVQFAQQVCKQFPWIKQLGFIGFSEGGKICVRAANRLKPLVTYIGFCNAILVKENLILPIKRPKLIDGRLVYDSEVGLWTNFNIVEKYENWLICENEISSKIIYAGVYSNDDPLSVASREFLNHIGIPISYVVGGDHLFTKADAYSEMLSLWQDRVLHDWPIQDTNCEHEFYIGYQNEQICIKTITASSAQKTLLYIHGLGQNKSGPSFLFTNMASELKDMNHVFFDFVGSGDSSGNISNMKMESYLNQLSFMINYVKELYPVTDLILVSSGTGNAYLSLCPQAICFKKIYFHPEEFHIWSLLSIQEKRQDVLDTFSLYSKYTWAEKEFLKLGNVFNRTSGFMVNVHYLKALTELHELKRKALEDKNSICVTNEKGVGMGNIFVEDSSYLLMSAKLRTTVINKLKNIYKFLN